MKNILIHVHTLYVVPFRVLSTGGGRGEASPQTPKLPPQNLVTDHGIQDIFGLSHIKSDLKTPQNQKNSWGILPQTPYTMCTSVVSYYIHCIVRHFPPKSTFLDRTLPLPCRVNSELDSLANVCVAFQVHCLSCVNPLVATEMFACSPSQLVVTKVPVWVQFSLCGAYQSFTST